MSKEKWLLLAGVVGLVLTVGWLAARDELEQELEAPGATIETSERLAIRPVSPPTTQSTSTTETSEKMTEEEENETKMSEAETKSSESESKDLVDNYSIELLQTQRDREAVLAINDQFFETYYVYESVSERNAQLAEIMIEELAETHSLSEEEAVHEVQIENYVFVPYLGTIENEQVEVLNTVEVKMDNVDVKMIAKITYGYFNEWQITDVDFELIR